MTIFVRVNRSDIKGHDSGTEQEISDPVTGLEGIKWSPNLDPKDSKSQSSRVPPETLPSVISANNVPVTKPSHTGDLRYLHANNEMFGVASVKGQPTVRLIMKKKWLISNIIYYSNSVASFNFLELTILLSGDVHTMPGPVNATTGRMIPVLTRHRKPNQSTIQPCMPEILRILRML